MTQPTSHLSAAQAVRRVLRAQLSVVREHLPGTLRGIDIEALHDLRVAVRRSRSVLGQVRKVMPKDETSRLKAELKWLGTTSGPTRDLDVYLDGLPSYFEHLDDSSRTALSPLIALLEQRRDRARAELVHELSSDRFENLMSFWQQVVASESTTNRGNRAVRTIVDKRILRAHRKVIADGRAIFDESPDQALHDLRIRCKKLRYLLELFRDLYQPSEIKSLITTLKKLQTLLGDFNDRAVQLQQTQEFRRQLQASGQESAACSYATEQLLERLTIEQKELRCRFGERFATFDQQVDESRYRRLFDA